MVSWEQDCCLCMLDGILFCMVGDEEVEVILGLIDDFDVDFCFVFGGGC